MKLRLLILALALIAFACKPKEYDTTSSGLKYKLYTSNKGPKAKEGDVIKFNILIKGEKDTQFVNTFKSGKPAVDQVQKPQFRGDLMEGLTLMAKGDSAMFWVPSDSLFKGNPKPPVKSGVTLKFIVKLLDIKPKDEYMKDMQKAQEEKVKQMEVAKKAEDSLLNNYIKEKAPNAKKTASGLYYIIEKPGTGPKPTSGQTVVAHYTGMFLDGKVFDTDSNRPEPFKFKLGQKQVIPGWDEGFALLNKGSKAKFIIPSNLAYGVGGNGMPPYAPLVFEVELLEIQ